MKTNETYKAVAAYVAGKTQTLPTVEEIKELKHALRTLDGRRAAGIVEKDTTYYKVVAFLGTIAKTTEANRLCAAVKLNQLTATDDEARAAVKAYANRWFKSEAFKGLSIKPSQVKEYLDKVEVVRGRNGIDCLATCRKAAAAAIKGR